MDSGDAVTSPTTGAAMMTEDNDSQMLVEHDVLQEQTAAAAAPSKLFPNQMGNTGFRRTESSHSSLFVTDQQEMVSTSSSSGNPSPRSSASSSARRRGGMGGEANPSRALNLGMGAGSDDQSDLKSQWEVNYKEAAIFLEEGLNNDKFTHHPRCQEALPAYLLVHNNWFHVFDVSAALVLLTLGFFEAPCTDSLCIPEQVHSSIEIAALTLVAAQLFLKTRWIGWRTFFKHKRTVVKVCALLIMMIEALVVLIRADNHFRVTRALRPIFLIDNHFFGGVRRFIRQILQSLPPILDMLGLVVFVMLIYSVFGFYLFGVVDPGNFGRLERSFVSLFVLLTTANYPDVMMKSYNTWRSSAIFFVSYLSINLYFLMNLMLAVVYDAFTRIEKEKFRRLFLHKRKAAQHAFKLLVTRENPDGISFQHFEGMLRHFKGINSQTEAYLVFKLLNQSGSGQISLDEFYEVYDATLYCWNVPRLGEDWFDDLWHPMRDLLKTIQKAVTSKWFEYTVYMVVLANGLILLVQTFTMESPSPPYKLYASWVSYFFVGLYTLEATLKLLGLGVRRYFMSWWNTFDFVITSLGIVSLVLEFFNIPIFYIVILRPLRLLTLFRMKRRFRDVFGTAVILYPRLVSAVLVLLLTYYFFAIIGMECFHNVVLFECCKNSSVEAYYSYEEGSISNLYFYLNNFKSMGESAVTLFELTVVNNWYVIMEGHTIASGKDTSRLFFMSFYIFTMIVMTIIVAFILEAFLFRIQFKNFLTKTDELKKLTKEILLTSDEVEGIVQRGGLRRTTLDASFRVPPNATFKFEGIKSRTKEEQQAMMYTDELDQWLAEARREETHSEARLRAALLQEQQQQQEQHSTQEQQLRRRSAGSSRSSNPSMRSSLSRGSESNNGNGLVEDRDEMVEVVGEDDDDLQTIHRSRLPDLSC